MKKILAILILAIVMIGCAKDADAQCLNCPQQSSYSSMYSSNVNYAMPVMQQGTTTRTVTKLVPETYTVTEMVQQQKIIYEMVPRERTYTKLVPQTFTEEVPTMQYASTYYSSAMHHEESMHSEMYYSVPVMRQRTRPRLFGAFNWGCASQAAAAGVMAYQTCINSSAGEGGRVGLLGKWRATRMFRRGIR